jgi:UDP-N-acetylglucosamine 4,6-dehydratase
MLDGKVILVTGGTGSFGRKFVEVVLRDYRPRKVIVFSRDELKQHEMNAVFPYHPGSPMRYFIGDVRDRDRLNRAFKGVDLVVHAAALKQVPACEYNPFEAVKTNVLGTKNVVDAALDAGVPKVMAISTDKAVNPINLYGATKLCAEKMVIHANAYSGETGTRFSVCRYGNVLGSRGSVVPIFLKQKDSGKLTVTDPRMTRFWITLEQGVKFVLGCIQAMHGGEVFVPKIPTMSLMGLAEALAPGCAIENIGIRPGEKLHEVLMSEDEARQAVQAEGMYVIKPQRPWWRDEFWADCPPVPEGFSYSSGAGESDLTTAELLALIESV